MDERLKEPEENYVSAEESMKRLRKNISYKLKVLLRAELEVAKAIEYYSEIGDVLPRKFAENVESAYDHPLFQKRYGNVRGLSLKNFPYLIPFYH